MERVLDRISGMIPDGLLVQADLSQFSDAIIASGQAHLPFAATLLMLTFAIGLAGRSLSLLLAGLAVSLQGIWLIGQPGTEFGLVAPQSAAFIQMLLLAVGALNWRRRLNQSYKREAALRTEQTELRFLLDREVIWRTAAEPPSRLVRATDVAMRPLEPKLPAAQASLGLVTAEKWQGEHR